MHMRRSDGALAILERKESQIAYLAFLRGIECDGQLTSELDLGRTWPNLQARAVNNRCDGVDVARIYRVRYVVNIHSCSTPTSLPFLRWHCWTKWVCIQVKTIATAAEEHNTPVRQDMLHVIFSQ